MRKYLHQTLQLERCVILSFTSASADLPLQVTCVRITKRSHSSASGLGVGKGSPGLMTASATSNFISITGLISAKVAESHSRGWTRSTGIVSILFLPSSAPSAKYPSVRSEGGQDCQKAQDEAQASGMINSAGLSSGNSMGSGPPDSTGSFVAMDLNDINSDYRGGVKAEPDNWMTGVLL